MPIDPVTYKTVAASKVEGEDENTFFTSAVAPNVLNTSTNVIAVEVHQVFKMDEDVSFDLQLIAQQSGDPVSYVTGRLYLDANGNGTQDSGEAGLANIDIVVTDVEKSQTVSTNSDGAWTAMVTSGSVTVDIDQTDSDFPGDATQTEGDDPTTIFAVEGETTFAGADGFYISLGGGIGDFVWNDANHDGVQDQGEEGVEGVTVTLFKSALQIGTPVTTDANGHYEFKALDPGDYHVQFSDLPAGAEFTIQNGGDDALDSDVNASGVTASFILSQDQIKTDIDAGIFIEAPPEPAQASGIVWKDINSNGIFDRQEKYIGFVTVNLLSADGSTLEATTTADRKGIYSFINIDPGDHIIEIVNPDPAIYDFSPKDIGSDDTMDSDVNLNGRTDVLTFASGENKTDINAGLAPAGSVPQSENDFSFSEIPKDYALTQNYPNPFNPETRISYAIKDKGKVILSVYNVQGRLVRVLATGEHAPGVYSAVWNGTDDSGIQAPSGLYFYKITVNDYVSVRKMTFMK